MSWSANRRTHAVRGDGVRKVKVQSENRKQHTFILT